MKNLKNQILLSFPVLIIGASAVVIQVVFIQELISQFYGNELCIGLALAFWLFWAAAGSAILTKWFQWSGDGSRRLAAVQGIWAICMLLLPWTARLIKPAMGYPVTDMLGFIPMITVTVILSGPVCLSSGFLYTALCQWRSRQGRTLSSPRIYTLEAIGAGIGGLCASAFALKTWSIFEIVLLIAAVNGLCALFIGLSGKIRRIILSAVIMSGCLSVWPYAGTIQNRLDSLMVPGQNHVESRYTPYGQITVTTLGDQVNVYENGLWLYTSPDPMTAEMAVHPVMLLHPRPQAVLMIGGSPEALGEILKHPSVHHVDFVDINPEMIRFIRSKIPLAGRLLANPEIQVHYEDARKFLSAEGRPYDVILTNLPGPYTNQLNRFYSLEFFRLVKTRLSPGGLYGFQVPAAENIITPELSEYISMLSRTVRSVFSGLIILPGETQNWLASDTAGQPAGFRLDEINGRIRERDLKTLYARDYYMRYNYSPERIREVRSSIRPSGKINTDDHPLGYYFDTILWATLHSQGYRSFFLKLSTLKLWQWGLAVCMTFLLLSAVQHYCSIEGRTRLHLLGSIFIVGFTEISLEIILMLGLQTHWGATVEILSLCIAAYMFGLSTGAWTAWKSNEGRPASPARYRMLQLVMSFFPMVCLAWLAFAGSAMSGIGPVQCTPAVFLLLTLTAGFLGGYQFVMANYLYIHGTGSRTLQAGTLYGLDLSGSAVGAFFLASVLIPALGMRDCLLLLGMMNGCMWIMMQSGKR
ncbi:hypothetical protein JW948_06720 [bacterium]|nr:hypothetical protein [bacterium]